MLRKYFEIAYLDPSSHGRLFRGIVKSKHGETLRRLGGISYTRLRELLLAKISELGLNPYHFVLFFNIRDCN